MTDDNRVTATFVVSVSVDRSKWSEGYSLPWSEHFDAARLNRMLDYELAPLYGVNVRHAVTDGRRVAAYLAPLLEEVEDATGGDATALANAGRTGLARTASAIGWVRALFGIDRA